jgi:hypothetical protein
LYRVEREKPSSVNPGTTVDFSRASVPARPSAPSLQYVTTNAIVLKINFPSGNGLPVTDYQVSGSEFCTSYSYGSITVRPALLSYAGVGS